MSSGQTITIVPYTHAVDFTVQRATPGLGTTVFLEIEDECGTWKTFVGGGTAAGF